jgi:hypothetical protein
MENKDIIIIKKHLLKQILLILICSIFVYISFLMINSHFQSRRMSPLMATIWGYLGLVFFGFGGVTILLNLISSKPALIIDSRGIINNSHFGGGYLIRWGNIKSVKIINIEKQKMIKIGLRNEEEIYSQVNYFIRKMMKLNSKFSGTPTFIPGILIKMKLDDLLTLIQEQKKNNSRHYIK